MSGIMMLFMAAGGGVVPALNCSADSAAPGTGSSTASVSFSPDGTISGLSNYAGNLNWYSPASTGIGAGFWVSFDGGAWQQLNAIRTTSLTGTNNSVLRTVRIATDAGGVNIVSTGSITLTVSNGA